MKKITLATIASLLISASLMAQNRQEQPKQQPQELEYWFKLNEPIYREIRQALTESDRSKRAMDYLISVLDAQFTAQVKNYQRQIDSINAASKQPASSNQPKPHKVKMN